jgi:NADH:ubiquinone oxidoreductase subunit E
MFRPLARARGNIPMSLEFSADATKKITALCERYQVSGSKKPVVLAALHLAQKEFGHLSDDALRLVARTLDLPYAHVFGVATFYTMFRREPGGKTTIRMCTNISCMLRGGYDVLAAFEKRLGLKAGESNKEFSLVEEECIAACANAPCAIAGTKYLLDLKPEDVAQIIVELTANPSPESEVV